MMTIQSGNESPANFSQAKPLRILSIDVEEYFHIEAAHGYIHRSEWRDWPTRVQANVELLLSIFEEADRKATFFVLGDVAAGHPKLIQRIADAGHEIASHGTGHDRLHRLNKISFRADLMTSKHMLEDLVGKPVVGYRAPTFSIVPQTAWAVDVLIESGFEYDASVFPVMHPAYGVADAPIKPFYLQGSDDRSLLEVPPLVWRKMHRNLAVAGGGYFRLLPLMLMKRGLAQAAKQNRPAVLYFHPWEFDPNMPRLPLGMTGRIRTYTGLATAVRKLKQIIRSDADWQTMQDALPQLREHAENQSSFDLSQSNQAA